MNLRFRNWIAAYAALTLLLSTPHWLAAQQLDFPAVVRGIDAAVQARIDRVASYTATEHYAVFRGGDEIHPAAEITVRTDYHKNQGKSFTILTESGSSLLRSQVLSIVLESEKQMSQPGTREAALINSSNYRMELKSPSHQALEGRDCLVLTITPRLKGPSLFQGTLWVDARDYSIVRLEATATKSRTMFSSPPQVMRQYVPVSGFAMAAHARAVSKSSLLGVTIVKIDSTDYQVQLLPGA
jgi:outer membrane lipoprotein-sorting protein